MSLQKIAIWRDIRPRRLVISLSPNRRGDMVDRKDSSAGTGIYAGFVAVLVVVGGLIALVAQNTGSVTVRWLGLEWTAPLTAVLLSAVLATVVIDEAIGAVWRRRRRRIKADRAELEERRTEAAAAPDSANQVREEVTS